MEGQGKTTGFQLEGDALPAIDWTFDMVEDRLVEAMITCWRHPDRERAWQRVRSTWPEMSPEALAGSYDGGQGAGEQRVEAVLRLASLTRRDTDEMEEAFGWLDGVDPADRKLIGLVVSLLARGNRQVRWTYLLRPMGLTRGTDGLRMRYNRALAGIAGRLNGGIPRASVSMP